MIPALRGLTGTVPLVLALLTHTPLLEAQGSYFPPKGSWERRTPQQMGLDPVLVQQAVESAKASESTSPRDLLLNHAATFGREPFGDAVGPLGSRGNQTGLIVYRGYIVAEWGEPDRVDPTFSVAKSVLSSTVGIAYDRGLIRDVHDRVKSYTAPTVILADGLASGRRDAAGMMVHEVFQPFEGEHNSKITWDHLLRQTSDWEGTLWGKPDWADRPSTNSAEWKTRPRAEPGTKFEYNDVRVNLLALAALNVWRRPLPQVAKEYLFDPIGASDSWRWLGYDNSWIVLDGVPVQSVSGGTHWGGGLFINAYDQARFGLLTLHRGKWNGRQILSEKWVRMALTPTPANPGSGFMNWYLGMVTTAPGSAFVHVGAGNNFIYVDPENELVIVTRWIQNQDRVVELMIRARGGEPRARR
ncbi:MAG: beta-lactamase family protein [Gemmatimonadetes bacterium]|nr:beta-lactamase family protein [Gemmatimonadota bacterium]